MALMCGFAGTDRPPAWHHHKNLITRHGRSGVRKAFHIASTINRTWYTNSSTTHTVEIYDALACDQPRHGQGLAIVAASLYPSIAALTAAVASPYWAAIAHSPAPTLSWTESFKKSPKAGPRGSRPAPPLDDRRLAPGIPWIGHYSADCAPLIHWPAAALGR
ncbi:hypothetical protein GU243_08610 [Pseudarthrobacter psychrotolerans]|uniref:Uncharacterized protein n=1 Tax=Pseudarthrobacter psychrotolerans TaxID=2697569 RepID=A0A6P1NSM2_9MICC|nr:hypothetical protein [Pseudarthrobacter psychrotolerans]QHK19781.1 hypothetical protein GU243_08610 [Pseudarthrobacter psychrotolerans]